MRFDSKPLCKPLTCATWKDCSAAAATRCDAYSGCNGFALYKESEHGHARPYTALYYALPGGSSGPAAKSGRTVSPGWTAWKKLRVVGEPQQMVATHELATNASGAHESNSEGRPSASDGLAPYMIVGAVLTGIAVAVRLLRCFVAPREKSKPMSTSLIP